QQQKEQLLKLLKERDYWTTAQVKQLIREKFNIEYSDAHIRRILRAFGLLYIKPYPIDYRKPQNAKEDLYTRLTQVVSRLESVYSHEEIGIGFLDETHPQSRANTQRVWAFGKVKIVKNTDRHRINAFGYYAYKGNSCLIFGEDATSDSVCKALEEIRRVNKDKKVVIVVLDNFTSHRSSKVKESAERLGIVLVYLPPYGSDLNPIEQVWRVVKRAISVRFERHMDSLRDVFREAYESAVSCLSFCKSFSENFRSYLELSA
ncbi:MAG: IS630 family transposase, partial [Aquificaceae bacterium]|nr:IS630 family transposase [Aquificaceae bacterium]